MLRLYGMCYFKHLSRALSLNSEDNQSYTGRTSGWFKMEAYGTLCSYWWIGEIKWLKLFLRVIKGTNTLRSSFALLKQFVTFTTESNGSNCKMVICGLIYNRGSMNAVNSCVAAFGSVSSLNKKSDLFLPILQLRVNLIEVKWAVKIVQPKN
jgi:hypothetical protein